MDSPSIQTNSEAAAILATVNGTDGDPLERKRWNVEGTLSAPAPDEFWKWLVLSLLSSQQKYTADSPIARLERGIDPFPVPLAEFSRLRESEVSARLGAFRFHQRIARQLIANHAWLFGDGKGWELLQPVLCGLLQQRNSTPETAHREREREAARLLADKLQGIGPKQARNLLQSLGLTRFEIPLDSRVTGWLAGRLGWNIRIEALSDRDYYEDLLDRVQASCERAGVLPTLFDAAVFEEMGKEAKVKAKPSTSIGYVNRNGQVVIRNTMLPGTDKNQYVYQLACSQCGFVYGANGSDIFQRKCPACQCGEPGLPLE